MIRNSDPFYSKLSDEQKKYFSEAIEKMGWVEFHDGMWNSGHSSTPESNGEYMGYKDNYTTERLYYQLQVSKEIPTDEEILNESRSKKLKEIL